MQNEKVIRYATHETLRKANFRTGGQEVRVRNVGKKEGSDFSPPSLWLSCGSSSLSPLSSQT